ncbi:MAG: hypothetical protein B7Z10_00425 [Rhodobacterales bacterium 32-66-7]|nr:MAG: hypothetical protein B7Z31_13060 [Rhodobacterales bacterium 12-65-15]OYX27426.1 MAG: hypothetical protein B7Z10_00425 [Rhodobacterales bacterium 32-66-7]
MTTQWTEQKPEPGRSGQPGVPLLVTRPLEHAEGFGRTVEDRFGSRIAVVQSPLMRTDFPPIDLPKGPHAAVIFTSIIGVAAVASLAHTLPKRAICVGKATAARARVAGFDAVSADGASEEVIGYLVSQNAGGKLLHLRGAVVRGDLAGRLTSQGIPTDEAVVYRQFDLPLSEAAQGVLRQKGPVIVPLFSPRSARLFQAQLPQTISADLHLVVISEAAAMASAGVPARQIHVAARPDGESLLDAVGDLLDLIAPP